MAITVLDPSLARMSAAFDRVHAAATALYRTFECDTEGHKEPNPSGCAYCGYSYLRAATAEIDTLLAPTLEDEPDPAGYYHRTPH